MYSSVTVNGCNVKFKFTCALDSLVSVISNAINNCELFKTLVQSFVRESKASSGTLLKLSLLYASEGPSATVYGERILLLCNNSFNKKRVEEFDCTTNAARLFEKLLENEVCSVTETEKCLICGKVETNLKQTVSVRTKQILDNGIESLEDEINYALRDTSVDCKDCKIEGIKFKKQKIGPYLCVDIEYVYLQQMLNAYKYPTDTKCNLKDIPQVLTLQDKTYVLFGAIEGTREHYIAYCRKSNNEWEKHDDIAPSRKLEKLNSDNLPSIKLSLIFYTECLL